MTLIRWKNGKPEPVSKDDDTETKKEVKKEEKKK
jgi:hypothetical protein